MKSYPKKYNKLFKVIESKKFKEFFEVATFRKRLSNKIHKTRIEQDMSQTDLKNMAQTTQRIISDVENGNYNMGIDLLYKVFKSLKKQLIVDDEDLITGEKILGTRIYFIESSSSINTKTDIENGAKSSLNSNSIIFDSLLNSSYHSNSN